MSLTRVATAIIYLCLTACRRTPELPVLFEHADLRMPFEVRLQIERNAPLIVVGRVEAVRPIGRPRPLPGYNRGLVQLTKISVHVDQLITGSTKEDGLEFFYYAYSHRSQVQLGRPWYRPDVGQRRMYFLREGPQGCYRSVRDVLDYTIIVPSGYHDHDFCQSKATGCCIGETLLIPGKNVDAELFAQSLAQADAAASVLCSRRSSLSLILRLRQDRDQRIREAAEEILRAAMADGEL